MSDGQRLLGLILGVGLPMVSALYAAGKWVENEASSRAVLGYLAMPIILWGAVSLISLMTEIDLRRRVMLKHGLKTWD